MAILELQNIQFNYSDKELYKEANLKLNPGEHACLVGVNGCGKTTLLEMIVGNIFPDSGRVVWENGISFSYLDQQLKIQQDMLAIDYLYGVYKDLFLKEKQMELLYSKAASGEGNYEEILAKASRIQDELLNSSFYSLQEKVGKLTNGLGIPEEILNSPLKHLSSGQREKTYLAKMLLEEHDVLLMDEPTNFLDAVQVNWLASYLNDYPKAFLLVSHDEEFLSRIANVVFILENKTITRYKGDYAFYKEQHALDIEQYKKNYEAQQRYIKKEEAFIAAHLVRATSSRAAKSRRARLAHLDVMDAPSKEEGKLNFKFPFTTEVGKKVLEVEKLEIGYSSPLLAPISFTLLKGQKIAILGKNGVGKTTFLKTILNKIPSLDGHFTWLDGTVINHFDQDENLPLHLSPFEYVQSLYPSLDNTKVRTLLGSYGVRKEIAMRKMSNLSGGEVAKTRLALMSLKKSNFLILDEPTNHLDIKAKDALFDAIENFPGSVIIVSHEKDFYDGLVDYELRF